ncbi:MAG: HD domain-containing protein [Deltaproteobacteria bacterium]|nr:HD domain-containing protein [Deltaproteobacteria bacterium]MCB9487555.1 HD domain-containing protein [Deltaproteobacteria bacterium]
MAHDPDIPNDRHPLVDDESDIPRTSTLVRENRFSRLVEISGLISGSLNPKVVWRRGTEAAMEVAGSEAANLFLVDPKTGDLVIEVSLGPTTESSHQVRVRPGEGVVGLALKNRETIVINNVARDPRRDMVASTRTGELPRSLMCTPLVSRGKAIGAIEVVNKARGHFTHNDQITFEALAGQVAVSISNAHLFDELQAAFLGTMAALVESIEKRDPYTGGHSKRVTEGSLAIADKLGLAEADRERLRLSAILHDVGKLGVDDAVLRKRGRLNDEEFAQMKEHPRYGKEILEHIPGMHDILPGVLHHHERYDGRGYPEGLKGSQIPLMARIIGVADTYDAMTSDRPYRKGLPHDTAVQELKRVSGKQFDPVCVQAFMEAVESGDFVGARGKEQVEQRSVNLRAPESSGETDIPVEDAEVKPVSALMADMGQVVREVRAEIENEKNESAETAKG